MKSTIPSNYEDIFQSESEKDSIEKMGFSPEEFFNGKKWTLCLPVEEAKKYFGKKQSDFAEKNSQEKPVYVKKEERLQEGFSSCEEIIDGKVCGKTYDSEKYECCYHCSLRKYAKRHGVTAAKKEFC